MKVAKPKIAPRTGLCFVHLVGSSLLPGPFRMKLSCQESVLHLSWQQAWSQFRGSCSARSAFHGQQDCFLFHPVWSLINLKHVGQDICTGCQLLFRPCMPTCFVPSSQPGIWYSSSNSAQGKASHQQLMLLLRGLHLSWWSHGNGLHAKRWSCPSVQQERPRPGCTSGWAKECHWHSLNPMFLHHISCHRSFPTGGSTLLFWSFLAAGLQCHKRMTTGELGRAINTLSTILNKKWMSGGPNSNRKGRTKGPRPKKRNGPSGSRNRWQSRILLINGSLSRQKHEFTALGPIGFFFSYTGHLLDFFWRRDVVPVPFFRVLPQPRYKSAGILHRSWTAWYLPTWKKLDGEGVW